MKADVVVPVYADVELTRACLRAVLDRSGDALGRLIVVNDRSPDPAMQPMLEALRGERVVVLENEQNLGFVASANRGMSVRERDVVLLNSDTEVTDFWLTELLEVAYAHDRVAAVTPLSNNATLCSVPAYMQPTPAAELPQVNLSRFTPRYTELPTGVGFCLLLRDQVLNMVGLFDPSYGRGYNEENDWCQRAARMGFVTLRANRALVYHRGAVSFGAERAELDRRNAQLLVHRHPHYLRANQVFEAGPQARLAAHHVRRRLGVVEVVVDATHLDETHGVPLLEALAKEPRVHVAAQVRTQAQRARVASLGVRACEVIGEAQVFHQPAQPVRSEEVEALLSSPAHAVVTFPDLLAYRSPSALPTFDEVTRHRAFSFAATQAAQAVIAYSEHQRQELVRELFVPPQRVYVVPPGVDHASWSTRAPNAVGDAPAYFLFAGSDWPHQNVKLLLEAYALFRARVAEPPQLWLSGPPSRSPGAVFDRTTVWGPGVRWLGELPPAESRGVLQGAMALVFPSAYEGFGLPVLEAMAAGVPVIASSLTAVPEVAGEAALYLRDFSPEELAAHLDLLATSDTARRTLVEAGRVRAARYTWAETARKTVDVYLSAIDAPALESVYKRQMLAQLFSLYTTSEARRRGA